MVQRLVMGFIFLAFWLSIVPVGAVAQEQPAEEEEEAPVEDPFTMILRQRVDVYRHSVGIAMGVINGWKRTTYSYGTLDRQTIRKVSNASVYEIGAATSVMTGVLLAHMVEKREVSLSDPVSKFLPSSVVRMPMRNGQAITLEHLATHTSGLPPLPDNVTPEDPHNPLATYTVQQLYAFLSTYTLTRDIGSTYEYSDLGMALLGHALALKAGTSYEDLLVERIFTPLVMSNTRIHPTINMKIQMATGHDATRRPVEPSVSPQLAGAGGMRSTVHDLMIFVSASMGIIYALPSVKGRADSVALAYAFASANRARHATDRMNEDIALGWKVRKYENREIRWQHGKTRGFYSFIGFDKKRRKGVVVLSNTPNSIDDIGFHMLIPDYPLTPPPDIRHVEVNPDIYDAYIGTYEFVPGMTVNIIRDGSKLYGQPPGQARNELLPETEAVFYLKQEDAQITFVRDESGKVTHILFLKNGQTHRANKIR